MCAGAFGNLGTFVYLRMCCLKFREPVLKFWGFIVNAQGAGKEQGRKIRKVHKTEGILGFFDGAATAGQCGCGMVIKVS